MSHKEVGLGKGSIFKMIGRKIYLWSPSNKSTRTWKMSYRYFLSPFFLCLQSPYDCRTYKNIQGASFLLRVGCHSPSLVSQYNLKVNISSAPYWRSVSFSVPLSLFAAILSHACKHLRGIPSRYLPQCLGCLSGWWRQAGASRRRIHYSLLAFRNLT